MKRAPAPSVPPLADRRAPAHEGPRLRERLHRFRRQPLPQVQIAEQDMERRLVRVPRDLLGEAETGVVKEPVAGENRGPELRERGGRRRGTAERLVQVAQLAADRL